MPIYLVGEADAGDMWAWPGSDRLRPLTRAGWTQARRIAEQLRGLRLERVLSSPYTRCRQTVGPAAEQLGLEVESNLALSEGVELQRALDLLARIREEDVLVCVHWDLLAPLSSALGQRATTVSAHVSPALGWSPAAPV